MRPKSILALACGASFLWAAPIAPAPAGTLQVNPVLVEVGAGRRTATVTVRNAEDAPVTIRAYPLGWTQAGGEDRYDESAAVIVSPPIFTIPAGGTQLVRVGLRSPSAAPQAFRLIVEEVPQARPDGGIQVALRLNLPLYINIAPGDAGALRWSAWPEPDGAWTVEAANAGPGYVRLDAAAARAATGIGFEDDVAFGTVLPGGARRWRIGAEPPVADRPTFQRIARTQGRGVVAAGRD